MYLKNFLTFLGFFFFALTSISGRPGSDDMSRADSLQKVLAQASHDTTRAYLKNLLGKARVADSSFWMGHIREIEEKLQSKQWSSKERKVLQKELGNAYYNNGRYFREHDHYERAIHFFKKSVDLYSPLQDHRGLSQAYNSLGLMKQIQGKYLGAIDLFEKGLDHLRKTDASYRKNIPSMLNNIGMVYNSLGDINKALEYSFEALEVKYKRGDSLNTGSILNNISMYYYKQGDPDKSMDYLQKSLKVKKAYNDRSVHGIEKLADAYWNIGTVYLNRLGDTAKCLKNLDSAAFYYQKRGGDYGKGSYYYVKGIISRVNRDYDSCVGNFKKVIRYYRKIGYWGYVQRAYIQVVHAQLALGQVRSAKAYADSSLQLAQKLKLPNSLRNSSELLYRIHKRQGNWALALENYERYIQMRDSLKNEQTQQTAIKQEMRYLYEKQAHADSIKAAEAKKVTDAKITAQEAQLEQERTQRFALYGGLALLFLFGGFMYNRFRITRKQKGIIEEQKTEVEQQKQEAEHQKAIVEEKNTEILDSINYARRLQEAILPPQKLVKEYIPESFILYKPKDIVAGDFYWMETVNGWTYFAAADCTGHGVPGAMVSVVCSNALTKALLEENIKTPNGILDRTRELVIETFGRSEDEIKDGMDISLCTFNPSRGEVHWSGANNPLWIVRNKAEQVEEIKADKQPVGKFAGESPFTGHEVKLDQGDAFYMFSDGYPDQFGGEKGKKYKAGKMKKFLLSIQNEPMQQQQELLNEEFEQWRGEQEQVDDVVVIGVKVTSQA